MRNAAARALVLLLLLAGLTPAVPASAQGGRRTVLVEFFCTQACQWAATAAQALDRVADEFGPQRVLAVEYNLDLDPALFERRFYLYVPPGTHVPFAFFDGSRLGIYGSNNDVQESYGWYREAAEKELAVPSPLRLEVALRPADGQAAFEVRVANVGDTAIEAADIYLGLCERGPVGRTQRFLRYLSPALPVPVLAPGEARLVSQTTALPPGVDASHLEGLAFVQQTGSNEVLQAAAAVDPYVSLSPTSWATMVKPGSNAAPQRVLVDGLGVPFRWTVEIGDADWLTVEPQTGDRGEAFEVRLDPAGLACGAYTATIVLRTDMRTPPTEHRLNVTLYVAPEVHTTYLPLAARP